MKWKCVCSNENENDIQKCPKCKRDRPDYLKIDIDAPHEFDSGKEGEMLMAIVLNLLNEAEEDFSEFIDKKDNKNISENETDTLRSKLHEKLKKCNRIIVYLRDNFPDFLFINEDGEHPYNVTQSSVELLRGRLIYHAKLYKSAINPLVNSYKNMPNQFALYLLAKCVINLPADSGASILKASKSELAYQIKHELELNLLRGVISMDHLSLFGIEAGNLLIDKYKFVQGLD